VRATKRWVEEAPHCLPLLHGLRVAQGRLGARLDRLLAGAFTNAANQRLAKHLVNHRDALFLFLQRPDVEATNWPAEQAIRPAVVNRKSCGGNCGWQGAATSLRSNTELFQELRR
jgi:hypothetical protein